MYNLSKRLINTNKQIYERQIFMKRHKTYVEVKGKFYVANFVRTCERKYYLKFRIVKLFTDLIFASNLEATIYNFDCLF